ncbi:MAG TPA: hypothetical protein EYH31_01525, partial [Anaerolineae bacterium]|nr:hypothetical protein [Anaerolineae bacterium]
NALTALPLIGIVGLPAASNLTLLLATVLSGYGAFLLTRYLLVTTGNTRAVDLAAVLAGLVYAFGSNRAIYAALGHYDMVTTQWIPFYALYLIKTLRELKWRNAIMAGLFFALAALAEMIFAVFLGIFTLIVLAIAWRQWIQGRWGMCIKRLGLLGATAALIWGPVLLPILREFLRGAYALQGWGEGVKLSTDLLGFITPTALHPLWGTDWRQALRGAVEGTARFSDVNTVFVGYATLALGLIGYLVHRRQLRIWAWTALLFGLFCLGPLLQINGVYRFDLDGLEVTYPMPFALLHYVPLVKANRAPNRNSVLLMLGLAVLVGFGVHWILACISRLRALRGHIPRLVASLLALILLFEHAALPLPLTDARVPNVYVRIAAEPGDFSLLQLPLGWRNSFGTLGSERTQVQYYQTVHAKPMLGGNISRNPPFKWEYFARIPLFQALTDVEMGRPLDPSVDAAARAQAAELMTLYDVHYVIMLPPIPGRYPYVDTWQATWEYARQVLPLAPEPFYDQNGIVAYEVQQPLPPLPFRLDLGDHPTEPYRGPGWGRDEEIAGVNAVWATNRAAELFIPVRNSTGNSFRLRVRLSPFTYPGAPSQSVGLEVNGQAVGTPQPLAPGWVEVAWDLPDGSVLDGLNRIWLHFRHTARPRDVLPGDTAIGSTGVDVPVDIEVNATADFAYITLMGEDGEPVDGSAGQRGYNLAVIDPRTGNLLDKRGFDTWANSFEANRMAEYIAQIPGGCIVVAATRGDAGRSLTDGAVAALGTLGSAVDLRQMPGGSHALIGVKGAAPGTTAEVVGTGGAWLRKGHNPDRRTLAAAVDWVQLELR